MPTLTLHDEKEVILGTLKLLQKESITEYLGTKLYFQGTIRNGRIDR